MASSFSDATTLDEMLDAVEAGIASLKAALQAQRGVKRRKPKKKSKARKAVAAPEVQVEKAAAPPPRRRQALGKTLAQLRPIRNSST